MNPVNLNVLTSLGLVLACDFLLCLTLSQVLTVTAECFPTKASTDIW